ncbi:M14 family metallopeptidase [Algihabitans albus]|uniref:M14 family metallopeptidase n=1 Tax=Algihabitans albus TaxID=2164067 RepID=UPI0035CEF717
MTTAATYFPESYAEARARFLAACADAEIAVEQRPNPNAGPEDEALYSDVAWIGPKDADSVLVVLSGTHGIEGFCGSGIQLGLLQSGLIAGRPNGLAVLLVHAINPYGFAWQRRVTEENVDLNRNWLDHGTTHPANPGYDALHPLLCPRDWSDAAIAESQAALDAWEATHGTVAFRAAVSGGQYSRADGIFFGGTRDTWAKTNLEEVLDGHLASAKRIGLIDIHTGLGPYGFGDRLLPFAPDDPVSLRAQDWFGGDCTDTPAGAHVNVADLHGVSLPAVRDRLDTDIFVGIALEYGTVPTPDVRLAVRADNWLHLHGQLDSPKGRAIKQQIRAAFYPDSRDWKLQVWERAEETVRLMYRGLTEG